MLFLAPDIPMSDDEFRLLRDFVYQHCGLNFTEESRYLLVKRLGKRVQHHRLKTFKEYYYFLRYNQQRDQELNEVIDSLTTNETYFFREDFQLKTFTQEIFRNSAAGKEKEGAKRLRIWSAGCSTGEEPYTIAMLLLDTAVSARLADGHHRHRHQSAGSADRAQGGLWARLFPLYRPPNTGSGIFPKSTAGSALPTR